ncbi:MAG: hypothetical protein GWO04_04660 [Actinobacteria bacterium]|nr:hypothetical protein [Actinomycetota bacterium]
MFTLQVTGALFVSAERSTETLEVAVTADGTIPRFMLRFDLDATPPAMATISAATGDLEVIGDTTYSVTAPALESIDDLAGVRAPAGFGVRVMPNEGPEDLTDRATALAFPPFDGWPTGPYVGLSGDTPTVARFDGTGFETFAVSDGINGPDRNVSRLQFGPPDGSYGPFLFVCSASFGDGDGVFSVSSAGDFAIWYDFNNCNGITFDRTGVAGDPGFLPAMYLNRNSDNMVRVDRMATPTTLTTGLSWGGSGHRLYAAEHPAFPTGLWLLFLGTDPSYDDGYLWNATVADPWPTAPEVLLPVLNGPRAVVLSDAVPWGDLVLILLGGTGELRAYRPDWTSFVVMDGITGGSDAVMGPDERVYIVERSLGRVLVLRPRRGA